YFIILSLYTSEIFTLSLHDALPILVAYSYAAAHPSEVRRLALLDAPIPGTRVFEEIERSPMVWHFAFHNVRVRRQEPRANRERRSEEHTSELQSHLNLVCRLLLEKK